MSGKLFDFVLVEREGYAFLVAIEYEKRPAYCSLYQILGHGIQQCKNLSSTKVHVDLGKHPKKSIPVSRKYCKDAYINSLTKEISAASNFPHVAATVIDPSSSSLAQTLEVVEEEPVLLLEQSFDLVTKVTAHVPAPEENISTGRLLWPIQTLSVPLQGSCLLISKKL